MMVQGYRAFWFPVGINLRVPSAIVPSMGSSHAIEEENVDDSVTTCHRTKSVFMLRNS